MPDVLLVRSIGHFVENHNLDRRVRSVHKINQVRSDKPGPTGYK
jgi:hypothetical protein